MVKLDDFYFYFVYLPPLPITLFGHMLKKSTHLLFGAWSFLLVHIWLTPSEGPKGFEIDFVRIKP